MSSVATSPSSGWKLLNGALKQVSVGNAREIWVVTDVNLVYRYTTSLDSMQVPGGLKCVAAGADGDVWGSPCRRSCLAQRAALANHEIVAVSCVDFQNVRRSRFEGPRAFKTGSMA